MKVMNVVKRIEEDGSIAASVRSGRTLPIRNSSHEHHSDSHGGSIIVGDDDDDDDDDDGGAWRKHGKKLRANLVLADVANGGNTISLSASCPIDRYYRVADRVRLVNVHLFIHE
jgi:hypothetical protein